MSQKNICNFVVALDSEARAIIEFYQLKRLQEITSHVVYACRDRSVYCIVSGMGMQASQSAVDFLAGWQLATIQFRNQSDAISQSAVLNNYKETSIWLNVGIAAHAIQPLGEMFRVNKVQSQMLMFGGYHDTQKMNSANIREDLSSTHYPMNTLKVINIKSKPLLSCYHVFNDYQAISKNETLSDYLFDMEGAGFVRAAKRYGSMELIQLIKIVSDNQNAPVEISGGDNPKKRWAEMAQKMVAQRMPLIDEYIQQLKSSVNKAVGFEGRASNDVIEREKTLLSQHYRFSHSQSFVLQNTLQSLYARFDGAPDLFHDYLVGLTGSIDGRNKVAAKQVLACLEDEIKQLKWIL